jgi:hypothetical protein
MLEAQLRTKRDNQFFLISLTFTHGPSITAFEIINALLGEIKNKWQKLFMRAKQLK